MGIEAGRKWLCGNDFSVLFFGGIARAEVLRRGGLHELEQHGVLARHRRSRLVLQDARRELRPQRPRQPRRASAHLRRGLSRQAQHQDRAQRRRRLGQRRRRRRHPGTTYRSFSFYF